MERRYSEKDETFWRKMVLSEEDRLTSLANTGWTGVGYRWFKSKNIICLEHYLRVAEAKPAPHQKAS
jgi:hypothetical protein